MSLCCTLVAKTSTSECGQKNHKCHQLSNLFVPAGPVNLGAMGLACLKPYNHNLKIKNVRTWGNFMPVKSKMYIDSIDIIISNLPISSGNP